MAEEKDQQHDVRGGTDAGGGVGGGEGATYVLLEHMLEEVLKKHDEMVIYSSQMGNA